MVIRRHLFFHTRIHKYIGNILVIEPYFVCFIFFPRVYCEVHPGVFVINTEDKIKHRKWDF